MKNNQNDIKKPGIKKTTNWTDINKDQNIKELVENFNYRTKKNQQAIIRLEGPLKKFPDDIRDRLTNLLYVSESTIGPINDPAKDSKSKENASLKSIYYDHDKKLNQLCESFLKACTLNNINKILISMYLNEDIRNNILFSPTNWLSLCQEPLIKILAYKFKQYVSKLDDLRRKIFWSFFLKELDPIPSDSINKTNKILKEEIDKGANAFPGGMFNLFDGREIVKSIDGAKDFCENQNHGFEQVVKEFLAQDDLDHELLEKIINDTELNTNFLTGPDYELLLDIKLYAHTRYTTWNYTNLDLKPQSNAYWTERTEEKNAKIKIMQNNLKLFFKSGNDEQQKERKIINIMLQEYAAFIKFFKINDSYYKKDGKIVFKRIDCQDFVNETLTDIFKSYWQHRENAKLRWQEKNTLDSQNFLLKEIFFVKAKDLPTERIMANEISGKELCIQDIQKLHCYLNKIEGFSPSISRNIIIKLILAEYANRNKNARQEDSLTSPKDKIHKDKIHNFIDRVINENKTQMSEQKYWHFCKFITQLTNQNSIPDDYQKLDIFNWKKIRLQILEDKNISEGFLHLLELMSMQLFKFENILIDKKNIELFNVVQVKIIYANVIDEIFEIPRNELLPEHLINLLMWIETQKTLGMKNTYKKIYKDKYQEDLDAFNSILSDVKKQLENNFTGKQLACLFLDIRAQLQKNYHNHSLKVKDAKNLFLDIKDQSKQDLISKCNQYSLYLVPQSDTVDAKMQEKVVSKNERSMLEDFDNFDFISHGVKKQLKQKEVVINNEINTLFGWDPELLGVATFTFEETKNK